MIRIRTVWILRICWLSVCLVCILMLLYYTTRNISEQKKKYDYYVNKSPVTPPLPVLVMACDRPSVKRCLDSIVKYRPNNESYPIIVSQDCQHEETRQVIKSFTDSDPTMTYVQQPNQSKVSDYVQKHLRGYYKIARHYKFALNYVFRKLEHRAAIIVEDDLEIALDFFEYFRATYLFLHRDPTIWCVSAWNDNGKPELVNINEPWLLHRTDFFPGLGWMLLSQTWEELEPKWPESYFDDWLRDPAIIRRRVCIRPEISRTFNFGRVGVSNGMVYDKHLSYTMLNEKYIQFTKHELSYLMREYEPLFFRFVESKPEVTVAEIIEGTVNRTLKYVRVPYKDGQDFTRAAQMFGLMDDLKHGVPRTALRGVVQFFIKKLKLRVFLVPRSNGRAILPKI